MKSSGLHPRNAHAGRYDFSALVQAHPELKAHVVSHPVQGETIDFSDPAAVKALNAALLKYHYKLLWWDIPAGHLCPPIPGRADYIHALSDLIGPVENAKILDVGVGANCIYPLLGHQIYGWKFIGSDVEAASLQSAQKILEANQLDPFVELRQQANREHIFQGVLGPRDGLTATMCNPPFHASAREAAQQSSRKRKNLGHAKGAPLNFGGRDNELWCAGGEGQFIRRMVEESTAFSSQCDWFTTLVSKEEHLAQLVTFAKKQGAREVRVIEQAQGQKKSRIMAWRF